MAKRVFVAGHGGLIGSAFIRRLRAQGDCDPIAASRGELDLLDQRAVDAFFAELRPAHVYLCAGESAGIGEQSRRSGELALNSSIMTTNCIRAARANGVEKFLYLGSSCMYGRDCEQPMRETALFAGRPEASSLSYAAAKLAGLQMCVGLNAEGGPTRFYPIIAGGIYGPRDESSHVIPSLVRAMRSEEILRVWGTGEAIRQFLYVDDLVDACLRLLTLEPRIVNVGGGETVTIRRLVEKLARVTGFKGRIEFDVAQPEGAPAKSLDGSFLSALGWSPSVSLDEGLARTVAWMGEHGD